MDKISHYYVSESSQSDNSDNRDFSISSDDESSKIFKNKNNLIKNNQRQSVNEKSESSHTQSDLDEQMDIKMRDNSGSECIEIPLEPEALQKMREIEELSNQQKHNNIKRSEKFDQQQPKITAEQLLSVDPNSD